jgi:hypothetical protein
LQMPGIAEFAPDFAAGIKQIENVDAVDAGGPGVGGAGAVSFDGVAKLAGGFIADAGFIEGGINFHAVFVAEGDAGLHRVQLHVAAGDHEVEEAVAEPGFEIEADEFAILDGIGHAHGDEEGAVAFAGNFFGHGTDAAHEIGHLGEFGGGAGLVARGGFEEESVTEEIEFDAVDIVVLADFLAVFEGEVADFGEGVIDGGPVAELGSVGDRADEVFGVIEFQFVGAEHDGAVGRGRGVVGVIHSEGPEDFDVVLVGEIDHDAEGIDAALEKFLGAIGGEHGFARGEKLADFGVVGEEAEAGAPSAVENGIDLRAEEGRGTGAEEFFGRGSVAKVDRLVAVVVEDEAARAIEGVGAGEVGFRGERESADEAEEYQEFDHGGTRIDTDGEKTRLKGNLKVGLTRACGMNVRLYLH